MKIRQSKRREKSINKTKKENRKRREEKNINKTKRREKKYKIKTKKKI